VPAPSITTHDELVLTISQFQQVIEKCGISLELLTREQFLKEKRLV